MIFTVYSGPAGPSITWPLKIRPPSAFKSTPIAISISIPDTKRNIRTLSFQPCRAANKQQTGSPKKKGAKKKGPAEPVDEAGPTSHPSPLPKPPAGFILDAHGRVIAASPKRIATIVDATNNLPLECVIRRVFRSSQGDDCMLLCPVDTPVQILKSTNFDGWAAVNDEEVEALIPAAAYALAKIHMHLVLSGFCYTARGGFCYSEEDILEFRTDDGQEIDGLPTEGIEITCFHQDENGVLKIADDDLLEDPAIISAIDEETEFNALVEEESALLESLLGER